MRPTAPALSLLFTKPLRETVMKLQTRIKGWASDYGKSFSFVGLVCGTLFFAASVTPSLVPRNAVVQGLLSGTALTVGYGVGILAVWLCSSFWSFSELATSVAGSPGRRSTISCGIGFPATSSQARSTSITEVPVPDPTL